MTNGVVRGDTDDPTRQERMNALLQTILDYENEVDDIDLLLRNLADHEPLVTKFLTAAREVYELETQAPQVAGG